jgi:hypothetical protein
MAGSLAFSTFCLSSSVQLEQKVDSSDQSNAPFAPVIPPAIAKTEEADLCDSATAPSCHWLNLMQSRRGVLA